MEFPELGQHCSESTCKRLDFLPVKCDACNGVFCTEHMSYRTHNCPSAYKKDVQVPVCPLCSQPVPVGKGRQPDEVVGAHMDNDCQSEPAQARRKVFENRCSLKGCKQKEVVPVVCPECQLNFCLRHRHCQDHKCEGKQAAARNRAAAAAAARLSKSNTGGKPSSFSSAGAAMSSAASRLFSRQTPARQPASVSAIQGSMSEDEALARALQESMQQTGGSPITPSGGAMSQEEEDRILALAIAESERQQRQPQRGAQSSKSQEKSCTLS